jgi:hypothetical protein
MYCDLSTFWPTNLADKAGKNSEKYISEKKAVEVDGASR